MNQFELDELARTHCTPRQRLILQLTKQGWSLRRIALHLDLSHSTIHTDLNRAIHTLTQAAKEGSA